MKHAAYPLKRSLIALAAMLLISTAAAHGQSPPPGSTEKPAPRQLNMLVLGDSISWGQGLKDDHKAWHLVKTWLQETTGRVVRERVEAHSGAVIGSTETTRISSTEMLDGEVNRAVPTVNEQIDAALKSYADPGLVDLVLVDGCINDIDALLEQPLPKVGRSSRHVHEDRRGRDSLNPGQAVQPDECLRAKHRNIIDEARERPGNLH